MAGTPKATLCGDGTCHSALNKVQKTYQTQLMHYKSQEAVTTSLIKKLKEERQAAEDKSKMGLGQIRDIVRAWKDRTKRLVQWWSRWAKQAAELQLLRADVENDRKTAMRSTY